MPISLRRNRRNAHVHLVEDVASELVTVFLAAMPGLASAETEPRDDAGAGRVGDQRDRRRNGPRQRCNSAATPRTPTLQALDVASTLRALETPGAYEANPMYAGIVDSPAKFIALKSVSTFATILSMQRFSKSHPKASFFVMAGFNSGYLSSSTTTSIAPRA